MYAVAGVSVILEIIFALTYHLPVGATSIELPWHTFFPEIGKAIIILGVQCMVGKMISFINPVGNSWGKWIVDGLVIGIMGTMITFLAILNKEERNDLLSAILKKIIRKRKWKK